MSTNSAPTAVPTSETSNTGGTGLDEQDQALAKQVALGITRMDNSSLTQEQAQCWANGIVTSLGYDRVKELGLDAATGKALQDLTGSEVSTAEAQDIISAMFDCMDVREMLVQSAQTPEEHKATDCVLPQLSDRELQDFMVADTFGIDPPPELATALQKASEECATDSGTTTTTNRAVAGADLNDQEFVGAVTQAIVDSGMTSDMTVGRCWADGMNADFGVARMRELNLADPATYNTGSAMTQDEATQAVASLSGCVDLKKLVVNESATPEARQSAQCRVDKLTDDDMKGLFAALLSGTRPPAEVTTKFQDAATQCGGG